MKTVETSSYPVQIWIAGDHAKAVEICRAYCDELGLCVTVTPTRRLSGRREWRIRRWCTAKGALAFGANDAPPSPPPSAH